MKLIIATLLTAILAFIAGIYFPWWSIAVVAFLIAVIIRQKPAQGFISGFLGVFITWILLAALLNAGNGDMLAGKIGALLGVGNSPAILILLTALVGGLVAGFAALTGSFVHKK